MGFIIKEKNLFILLSGRARIMEHAVYEYIMYVLLPNVNAIKVIIFNFEVLFVEFYLFVFINIEIFLPVRIDDVFKA